MCLALAGAASGRAAAGPSGEASGSSLASPKPVVREVGTLESDRIGTSSPVGLAFASSNGSFYLTGAPKQMAAPDTTIARLKPFALRPSTDRVGSSEVAASVRNRINVAFDDVRDRLLLLREDGRRLFAIQANADGSLDPTSLMRYDVSRFGLGHPRGWPSILRTGRSLSSMRAVRGSRASSPARTAASPTPTSRRSTSPRAGRRTCEGSLSILRAVIFTSMLRAESFTS